MYYPLYAANKWVEPLDTYLNDTSLTDPDWFQYDDIITAWREANQVDGKPYGMPYDGEMTVQVYRKDLYDAKGLKPAETLEQFVAQRQGAARSGEPAVGRRASRFRRRRPEHVHLSLDLPRAMAATGSGGKELRSTATKRSGSLDWYVDTLTKYAPQAARNWNWPDIADAFSRKARSAPTSMRIPRPRCSTTPRSRKVIGKIGFARWPKGPSGKRVTSIWNWGFPINAALSDKAKRATWLFISWAASAETQARTSWKFAGRSSVSGLNRLVGLAAPGFAKLVSGYGNNFGEASLQSLEMDTDVDWRPRVPQWPALGDSHGDRDPGGAGRPEETEGGARRAQRRIDAIMKG